MSDYELGFADGVEYGKSMNKHEQLVHSSFPKPNKKPTALNKGSPIANIGMMQPEDSNPPMMNPGNPAEY